MGTTGSLYCSEGLGCPKSCWPRICLSRDKCSFSLSLYSLVYRQRLFALPFHLFAPMLKQALSSCFNGVTTTLVTASVRSPKPMSTAVPRVWVEQSYNVWSQWSLYQASPIDDCGLSFLFLGLLFTPGSSSLSIIRYLSINAAGG